MDVSNNVPNVFVDNDRREDYGNVILVECNEIKLGMQVGSEEEAYNLYSEYALKKGFSIQKWNKWEVDGILKQQEYVCSKQEYKQFEDPFIEKKKNFKSLIIWRQEWVVVLESDLIWRMMFLVLLF